jgi:uncharacterized membrane protein
MLNNVVLFSSAPDTISSWVEVIIAGIEMLAVVVIVIVIATATIIFLYDKLFRRQEGNLYEKYRRGLARAILVGLEILIAADVIRTVVLDRTFEAIAVLGLLVVVRILLSWSLLVEIEGRWPWQPKGKNDI